MAKVKVWDRGNTVELILSPSEAGRVSRALWSAHDEAPVGDSGLHDMAVGLAMAANKKAPTLKPGMYRSAGEAARRFIPAALLSSVLWALIYVIV